MLVGGAGVAAAGAVAYDAVGVEFDAVVLGKSAPWWGAVGGGFVVGAALTCIQRRPMLRVASSLAGGGALVVVAHLVASRAGATVPAVATVGVLGGATLVGVVVQGSGTRCECARRPAE